MRACRIVAALWLILFATSAIAQQSDFNWNWRNQEIIGHSDASIGNTSQVTEPERSALIDAIVLRLQKPMSDAGYDDDRIREIATTTRVRFVDMGEGKPLLFATSLGLEGGCDALGNCPLWIFRRTDDGFLSLLTSIAASYTVQQDNGSHDLVLMHHASPQQSGLMMYGYGDEKLTPKACYVALWPKPSDDPTQLAEPKIEPCKDQAMQREEGTVKPIPEAEHAPATEAAPQSSTPEQAKPDATAPAQEQPKADQAQPAPQSSAPEQAKPDATAPAQEEPKADQAQPAPQSSTPEQAKPDATAPAQEQPKADQAQPAPQSSTPEQAKPDTMQPEQQPPQAGEAQPPAPEQQAPDSKQAEPKPDQAQPDSQPNPGAPDQPQPAQTPAENQSAPPPTNSK